MLKSMFRLTAIVAFSFLISSCNKLEANEIKSDINQWMLDLVTPNKTTLEKVDNGFSISGSIKNSPEHLLILWELTPSKLVFIDSCRTDKAGKFKLTGNTKEQIFCQLQMGPQSSVYLALDNKSKLSINLSLVGSFVDYTIEGNELEDSKILKTLINMNQSFSKEVSALERTAQGLTQNEEGAKKAEELRYQYAKLMQERDDFVKNTALNQTKGFIPYFAISYGAIQSPDYKLMQHAVNCAKAADPNSKYTQEIENKFTKEASLMDGAVAPDIQLKSPEGNIIKLSSLKGKVVLIDFWASWCGPCRRENPNVRRVYQRFKDKGFEIYGVSLDNDASRWKGAIAADQLEWLHVSDLMGWQSSAAQLYQVHSIPQTILLDREGRIIAKGLRGEQLEEKLAELLEKTTTN
jgi:peroxiredoxin